MARGGRKSLKGVHPSQVTALTILLSVAASGSPCGSFLPPGLAAHGMFRGLASGAKNALKFALQHMFLAFRCLAEDETMTRTGGTMTVREYMERGRLALLALLAGDGSLERTSGIKAIMAETPSRLACASRETVGHWLFASDHMSLAAFIRRQRPYAEFAHITHHLSKAVHKALGGLSKTFAHVATIAGHDGKTEYEGYELVANAPMLAAFLGCESDWVSIHARATFLRESIPGGDGDILLDRVVEWWDENMPSDISYRMVCAFLVWNGMEAPTRERLYRGYDPRVHPEYPMVKDSPSKYRWQQTMPGHYFVLAALPPKKTTHAVAPDAYVLPRTGKRKRSESDLERRDAALPPAKKPIPLIVQPYRAEATVLPDAETAAPVFTRLVELVAPEQESFIAHDEIAPMDLAQMEIEACYSGVMSGWVE